eukprot:Nitzschia sp. Nitz4//scaffold2_size372955//66309//67146//NITZ4_000375-RA/size372955-snap-gene-0.11-mRNA-1//1//CDS//3329546632//2296//frame0
MSFGNGYNGGRTKMKTMVYLNLYDLSPANDYLFPVGLGFHHSGIEVLGREYSFGAGGSGIFDGPPRVAPGAKFRMQVELGSFDGGTKELNQALDDLRTSGATDGGGFGPNDYNLVRRNCNHFCNALSWKLLHRTIPPYVNRMADIGNCCSCLLPKHLIDDSPVGGKDPSESQGWKSSYLVPTAATMNRGPSGSTSQAFAGKGHSLGGDSVGTEGVFSSLTRKPAPASDDLTDRREKARKAALARLERNQQSS